MKKADIVTRLEALGFDRNEYWAVAGTAMVLYGLRAETHDVDLGCAARLADELQKQYPTTVLADGTRKIIIPPDIEIFEAWLYDRVVYVDGFPVISPEGLLEMKKTLNREKDQADIQKIEAYISARQRTALREKSGLDEE